MFLNPSSFNKSASYSMEHFKEWSHQIASAYFTAGDLPTDGLVKVAEENGFVPHQVQTLAGEINKLIHQQKYASATEKYHAADFPLADAKEALKRLQADGGEVKLAVSMSPPKFDNPADDPATFYKMFGVSPEEIDKTASVKHEITNTFQKMSHVRKKYQEEEILNKYAYEAAENAFIKTARQMIINETTAADRTQSLATVHHFCKEAGLGETYKKPLAKLAYALTAEGMLEPSAGKKVVNFLMEKSADQKVPTELISPLLKARVVNGNHPLYIKLKTLKDCQQAYDLSKDRFQLVDDKLQILGQKVRAL